MIPRRLRKYVAVVAGALVAGVPVAMIHRGLDAYIERQATEEARLAAQRAIARAEWRIGQSIAALAAIGTAGLEELRRRRSRGGAPRRHGDDPAQGNRGRGRGRQSRTACLPARRASARAVARAAHRRRSRVPRVIRQAELDERALRVTWRRAGDPLQLVAHIPADVFLPDGSSGRAASDPVVRVMLSEGTLIAAPRDRPDGAAEDGDSIRAQNQSTRYPLIATATVSRAAVFAEHARSAHRRHARRRACWPC